MIRCAGCGTPQGRPGPCAGCLRKQLNPADITLVTGAPASGKSTYVEQNAQPGDVIVDLDRIAEALGSPTTHDHPGHLTPLAIDAYDAVVNRIASGRHEAPRVWVVRCAPTQQERVSLARRLGVSRTVVIDTPPDEAKARAKAAGRPDRYADLIDQWWAEQPTATTP